MNARPVAKVTVEFAGDRVMEIDCALHAELACLGPHRELTVSEIEVSDLEFANLVEPQSRARREHNQSVVTLALQTRA